MSLLQRQTIAVSCNGAYMNARFAKLASPQTTSFLPDRPISSRWRRIMSTTDLATTLILPFFWNSTSEAFSSSDALDPSPQSPLSPEPSHHPGQAWGSAGIS